MSARATKSLKEQSESQQERYYVATQWQLMGRKFRRHKLAIVGAAVLAVFYLGAFFCEVLAPYDILRRFPDHVTAPPQRIRFFDQGRFQLRPFVYGYTSTLDTSTFQRVYTVDPSKKYPIRFFVTGDEYEFWGLFRARLHLFGVRGEGAGVFLLGTDGLGRDVFSRLVYAARVSLTIGLVGVFLSLVIGISLGGISGFYGGAVDDIIQRLIEFLRSIPTIPLWMGLSAALPVDWPVMRTYFAITIILSIVGWTGVARVVRGKIISLREEDFVLASKIAGAKDGYIVRNHLVPSFLSYIIVSITLAIPNMILGETALSFLGLGLRPPAVSWGVLLQDAQNMRTVAVHPWLLLPALFVIITVLAFNFLGDGLRDAADPYR
jgi:peptide/nickel transport system permease protein